MHAAHQQSEACQNPKQTLGPNVPELGSGQVNPLTTSTGVSIVFSTLLL